MIYFYVIEKIEHHWDWLPTLDEISTKLIANLKDPRGDSEENISEINYLLSIRKQLAIVVDIACRVTEFDGYFGHEPKVFLYPFADSYCTGLRIAFIWSAERSHKTFIASNHVLPWKLDCQMVACPNG